MEENVNMKYLDDQFGHMNANILLELKNDLMSMDLKQVQFEVQSHSYPIENYENMNKEALITEIIIWRADNDVPVEADELAAVLNDDIDFLNQEQHNYEIKEEI